MKIPFIDIFAGPGGLSEGFSRYSTFCGKQAAFESRLAIEKDPVAVETLRLRSFFRQFDPQNVPIEYYRFLKREGPLSDLQKTEEWKIAENHVWQAELGKIDEVDLHSKLAERLEDTSHWVLLGGPPCQAYSLMGRARMTGVGNAGRNSESEAELEALKEKRISKFEADHRHYLYREYLRIVAVHQPSVFVMENVKGILSAKLPENSHLKHRRVFDQIRQDLSDPWLALEDDPKHEVLASFRKGLAHRYRLYSFVTQARNDLFDIADQDFLIRAEHYGVPQKRHRVIILGVRDDVASRPEALGKGVTSTLRDAIGDLPQLRSGLSKDDDGYEQWRSAIRKAHDFMFTNVASPIAATVTRLTYFNAELDRGSSYTSSTAPVSLGATNLRRWLTDENLNGVLQHESRSHMATDLVRYLYAATEADKAGASPSLDNWPVQLLPNHKNVSVDVETGKPTAEGFHDRFKVQTWNSPSSTITSHIAKDGHFFIHPDPMQCRSLTVREAARLQTFPDNYFFCGNRTQQYHQIGNAVPPYLAVQLAEIVANLISGELI